MILTVGTWKIRKGQETASEEILRRYVKKVESEQGTLAFAIYRKTDDPVSYIVVERYRDENAMKEHMEKPYRKDLEPVFPMLDGELNLLGSYQEVVAIKEKI